MPSCCVVFRLLIVDTVELLFVFTTVVVVYEIEWKHFTLFSFYWLSEVVFLGRFSEPRNFQHAHFIPIVGVGKWRRTLIGPW